MGDLSRAHPDASVRILAAHTDGDGGVGLAEIIAPDLPAVVADIETNDWVTELDLFERYDQTVLVQFETTMPLLLFPMQDSDVPLTGERIEALSDAGLRRVALSIDGDTADAHDAFRGEYGSFDRTVEAAREARAAGLPLQINTTVCAKTVDEPPAIRALVDELDAVLWSVFFLVPVGRGQALDPVPPARAERVMEWLTSARSTPPSSSPNQQATSTGTAS